MMKRIALIGFLFVMVGCSQAPPPAPIPVINSNPEVDATFLRNAGHRPGYSNRAELIQAIQTGYNVCARLKQGATYDAVRESLAVDPPEDAYLIDASIGSYCPEQRK